MTAAWNPIDTPVDRFLLKQKLSPGLCEVVGASSPRKWDELDGFGLSGARLRFRGVGLAHFSIKVRLYTTQDWTDWYAFEPLLRKPPVGKRAAAYDIYHPVLVNLGIASVVVEDVGGAEQTDDGEWTIEIKFIEFRKPVYTVSSPEGAEATPVDPVEQRIGELTSQYQKLASQADAL